MDSTLDMTAATDWHLEKLRFLFSVGPDQPRVELGSSMIREVVAVDTSTT